MVSAKEPEKSKNFIKFLGTAGARFVMIQQLRYSAGVWLRYKKTDVLIDPGPGSLVRCLKSKPKLNPCRLDGIFLTHKHLDHSGDINVIIEAMTEGGSKKRGSLFLPSDALGAGGVVFSHFENKPEKLKCLKEGERHQVKDIEFLVASKNRHSVETYGFKFYLGQKVIGWISDTANFSGLAQHYAGVDILIVNVVFFEPRADYQHLCLEEAVGLVQKIKPEKAIFTHFGMTILKEKPHLLEEKVKKETGLNIKFAYDGMNLEIS